jgi:hypothetical protein
MEAAKPLIAHGQASRTLEAPDQTNTQQTTHKKQNLDIYSGCYIQNIDIYIYIHNFGNFGTNVANGSI